MKIGLGITTCSRPELLKKSLELIESNNIRPHRLFINDDSNTRKGVSYSKNNCIYNLQDCDLIILLDDDCFITSPGALDFIAEGHEATAQGHFLYMSHIHHEYVKSWWPTPEKEIELFNNCSGVFMSITKETFNKVGYLDSRYVKYGYEHAGFSRRVHMSGLNSKPFMMLAGMHDYFTALDFEGKIDSALNEDEKNEYCKVDGVNDKIYHEELRTFWDLKREFKP